MRPRVSRAGRDLRPLAVALALLSTGPAAAAQPDALPPWDPRPSAPKAAPTEAPRPAAVPAPVPPPAADQAPPAPSAPADKPALRPGPVVSAEIPPPPTDPNDAPFMRPPNNQLVGKPPRTRPDIRPRFSSRRRFALTLAPAFASFRLPFQARPANARYHGAGFNLELDAQLFRWVWLRVQGTYSGHPIDEVRVLDDEMNVVQTAPRGTIHATGFGAGPVFALDLGRWLPLIEVGLGGLRIATPPGGNAGQRGQACRSDGTCDTGLACNAGNTCQPSLIGELYFGLALDVLIRRHISFGGQFRYYALLTAPGKFPVYLIGTLRLAVRF